MSIIQWLGIMSATFIGQASAFWIAQIIGRRTARRSARVPELRIMRFEPEADDCGCDICQARRRKQAEVAAN